MTLQIEVTGPELMYAGDKFKGKIVNIVYHLKCWKEGDNPEIDTPVIGNTPDGKGMPFPGKCKTEVAGKTLDELVTRVEQKAIRQMQRVINIYKDLDAKAKIQRVADSSTNIQEGLVG